MKIVTLTASNIKKIKAVEITPDGNMIVIGGKNAAGTRKLHVVGVDGFGKTDSQGRNAGDVCCGRLGNANAHGDFIDLSRIYFGPVDQLGEDHLGQINSRHFSKICKGPRKWGSKTVDNGNSSILHDAPPVLIAENNGA